MRVPSAATVAAAVMTASAASAQVSPVRSSVESDALIGLSVVGLSDQLTVADDQGTATGPLGQVSSPIGISSGDGVFSADATSAAAFVDEASGSFVATQTYRGVQTNDEPTAQSFTHNLSSTFEYDFTLPAEGSINFQGDLFNSGPSFIGFTARVRVFQEFMPGSGFTGAFFDENFTDLTTAEPTAFAATVPLNAASGSYRVRLSLQHSGNSVLDTPEENGSLTIDWSITATTPCPADVNGDGTLDDSDFFAWVTAFTATPRTPEQEAACDVNRDGSCTDSDFFAWVTFFTGGGCEQL